MEIRIRDNGTGILLEIREKMFTPLFCARIHKCLALRRKKALWCNRRTRNVIKNGRYQFTEDCDRVAETLRRIGDKWSVPIIVLLELGHGGSTI